MLTPEGIVASWNAGARKFKGYEPSEIIGEHFSRFYTDEDRARGLPARALDTAKNKGKFENEGWRVRKDGTHFWAHVIIDPIFNTDRDLIGYAKITRDLTERRAAEEELRKSEEQFKILVQGVTDYAIYMLDREGNVTSWNAGAARIKGYLANEIIGSHFSRFYTQEDRDEGLPKKALETAAREGRFEKEGWRVRKDGSTFWASVVIDPIRDDADDIIGFAKITRDITERRNSQLSLEQTREALFQSQKMEAIGQLTGGVAHDFNNLLMAILGSLDLVRRRMPDDPKLKKLIDNAIQGAQRGANLTQRMLAFARRQELRLTTVDLPILIVGIIELLQRALGSSILVKTDLPANLKPVKADQNQLELAILNLAMNARDAMPKGGTITIEAEEKTIQGLNVGSFICLCVTDMGVGMDEATLAKATEPFFTTKGVGKGTGLGLSMVHGVAEQTGGRLVLKSKKGEGTTAELWIPVATESDKAAAHNLPDAPTPNGKSLTVLAVDDDSLVLVNTVAMLEELGHQVFSAHSGMRALEIFQEQDTIDLVVTDQSMPLMSGVQLAEILRNSSPKIPIILASGFADLPPGTQSDLPRLTKPFGLSDLRNSIERTQLPPEIQGDPGEAKRNTK